MEIAAHCSCLVCLLVSCFPIVCRRKAIWGAVLWHVATTREVPAFSDGVVSLLEGCTKQTLVALEKYRHLGYGICSYDFMIMREVLSSLIKGYTLTTSHGYYRSGQTLSFSVTFVAADNMFI